MAYDSISGFSPDGHAEVGLFYGSGAGGIAEVTSAATIGGISPQGSTRWAKLTDGGVAAQFILAVNDIAYTSKTYVWAVFEFIVSGNGSAGQNRYPFMIGGLNFGYQYQSATTFKMLLSLGGDPMGTTTLNTDTSYRCRLTFDGASLTLDLESANADIVVASGVGFPNTLAGGVHGALRPGTLGALSAGQIAGLGSIILRQSNSTADRPDFNVRGLIVTMNGEGAEQGQGNATTCAGTGAVYTDVTLDGSLLATDATYWCCPATPVTAAKQTAACTAPSTPANTTPQLLVETVRVAVNTGSKGANNFCRITDGGSNSVEGADWGVLSSVYVNPRMSQFRTAPGGGTWAAFTLANLEMGVDVGTTTTAEVHTTTVVGHMLYVGDDPPAAAADRRRLLAGVT